jgi:hypothetical protein
MTNGQSGESEHGTEHELPREHGNEHESASEHASEPMPDASSEKPYVVWSSAPQSFSPPAGPPPVPAASSEPSSGGSEGSPHHE